VYGEIQKLENFTHKYLKLLKHMSYNSLVLFSSFVFEEK
jgi:hypothetical protein